MAVRSLKKGDLVRELGTDYVVIQTRNGISGTVLCVNNCPYVKIKSDFQTIYFEKADLAKMKRRTPSQVSKKLRDKRNSMAK